MTSEVPSGPTSLEIPSARPWRQRVSAAPWVPGAPDQIIGALRGLLAAVAESAEVDASFTWTATGGVTTVRAALQGVGSCGLVTQPDRKGRVELTPCGAEFLQSGEPQYLMKVLHSHVKFFGEALSLLNEFSSHEELNRAAAANWRSPVPTSSPARPEPPPP